MAQAQEICWTPQDDVLLKNAVEVGASWESLTEEGPAIFSRGFTVQQLKDRWNDLSSPPLVSVEEKKSFSEKRKCDNQRQQHSPKQKRICHQASNFKENSGFRSVKGLSLTIPGRSHSLSAPLDLPPIEEFSTPKCPDMGTLDSLVNACTNEFGYNVGLSEVMPQSQLLCRAMKNSGVRADNYLSEFSNSVFDFTNEEENHLMDSDKDYIDGFYSLLLDSPSENGMPNIAATEEDGKERPSASNPEDINGVIVCTLNTEDPDIPANEDVFLLTGPPLYKFASPIEMQRKIYEEAPSLGRKVNAGDPNQKTSERNILEQAPATVEALQAEEDSENSDVEILL